MSVQRNSRYRGALLGLAVGDALGTTVELQPRGSFSAVADLVGGGPFGLRAGQWTDDTSMALCLARSLIDCGGFDAGDQMSRFVRWWRTGYLSSTGDCFDIGTATRAALARYERSGDPFAGSRDPKTAGNGSLMRLAPVAMYFASEAIAEQRAAESSRTTHAADEAVDACRLFARILARALEGASREEILAPGAPFDPPLAPALERIRLGSYRRKRAGEIRGSGYAVESLEAALWCFAESASFAEAVLRAVNLGDDADTTAAITGQLAGAFFGDDGIPKAWRERLHLGSEIARLADALRRAPVAPEPPISRSYWANPGAVLASAYPGSPNRGDAERMAERLVGAGVQVFVNLMEAHETDRQGRPFEPYEDLVRRAGVKRGLDVECMRFPIADLRVPTEQAMHDVLSLIDARVAEGRVVLVHCWGGRGRTGTVIGSHLVRHGQADREDFVEVIARRRQSSGGVGSSPETAEQVEFVRRFGLGANAP